MIFAQADADLDNRPPYLDPLLLNCGSEWLVSLACVVKCSLCLFRFSSRLLRCGISPLCVCGRGPAAIEAYIAIRVDAAGKEVPHLFVLCSRLCSGNRCVGSAFCLMLNAF